MKLPFDPPVAPMLAKLQRTIPVGDEWLYEPKWDGFRAIVFYDGDEVYIESRDERPFNRYFPELPPIFAEVFPKPCVVDGEIIVPTEKGIDFGALLQRIHPAKSRVDMLAEETPAGFVAFDLLALGTKDLREQPFADRRAALEDLLENSPKKEISVTDQTRSAKEAEAWFDVYETQGFEGVVAKKDDQTYLPGKRAMIKVKRQRTADVVVGGYRLSKGGDGVGSLLLGLYDAAGVLQFVGHTSSFKAAERRALLEQFEPLKGDGGFGGGRTPGGQSRWATAQSQNWVPLRPELVCEVSFDRFEGERFRHAATFLHWRTDKKPRECTVDQVMPSSG